MRFKRGLYRATLTATMGAVLVATLAGCDGGKKHAAQPATPPSSQSVSTSAPGASQSNTAAPLATSSATTQPSTPPSPSVSAQTDGLLHAAGTVRVPLASTGLTLQAEAPDGTVFVGTPGGSVVWTAKLGAAPAVAEHVAGGADAIAADASYLYIASGHTVYAYARSTGDLARQWALPAGNDAVLTMAPTGSRLWVRMGMQASDPPPGAKATLVELDKSGGGPLRQVSVPWTTWLAAGPGGLYYVLSSQTLIEQTDAGSTESAPVNDPVNLQLSGPDAIEVVGVDGNRVIAVHFAGQGLDAVLDAYDATTLKGPSQTTEFWAAAQVVVTDGGVVAAFADMSCGGTGDSVCVRGYPLGSHLQGGATPLPAGELLGGKSAAMVRWVDEDTVAVSWLEGADRAAP